MRRLLLLLVCCLAALPLRAQQIAVASASDLQPALTELAQRFEREARCQVKLSFGSSGKLFAQIQNGAPYDLFFSADMSYAQQLAKAGLSEEPRKYAEGKLVLWARKDSGVDVSGGLATVSQPQVRRIAIANPQHAPYGRAAVAALKAAGLYDKVKEKLVFGENISQAATFAASGNAEVGLIALSLARAPAMRDEGAYAEIDPRLYPPIEQGVVLINSSQQKALSRAFLAFVARAASAEVLRSYGFDVPATKAP